MLSSSGLREVRRFLALALATLFIALSIVGAIAPPARAATTDKCDGTFTSNSLKVTASHGKIFYIDSGQGQNVDAAYLAYQISNTSGSAKQNLFAKVDTFTGGVVSLANPMDAIQPMGDISGNTTKTAFFLVKASSSATTAQSHTVKIYSGNPNTSGATLEYSCSFSFVKVSETIKARANKVETIQSTSVTTLGSTMTITVEGASGTIGQGNSLDGDMIWLSPVARSTWPTQSLRLESTVVDVWDNKSRSTSGQNKKVGTYTNQLQITDTNLLSPNTSLQTQSKVWYTAVYTFRVIGPAPATVTVLPVAQISSGTQVKHTDISAIPSSTVNATSVTVSATASKSVSQTVAVSGSTTTLDYTVSIVNSGASPVTVDEIVDTPSTSLSFVAGSAKFNAVSILDAKRSLTDSTKLIFSGPFSVPANSTRTLTYKMAYSSCSSGSFSFQNSAVATIGSYTIGTGPATMSVTTAGGTCGQTTLTTATTTTQAIPVEVVTSPATSITNTTATLNGLVDPNGNSNRDVVFEWGTSSTLVGSTSVLLSAKTTIATTPYAVSTSLSGLSTGTIYYFRLKVSDGNGGYVADDILSFVTTEPVANPTVTTKSVTNITVSGSSATAVLTGSVDPNQITNGAKVKYQYAADTSSGSCTSLTASTALTTGTLSGFVQSEYETANGTLAFEDAVFNGAFSTDTEITTATLTTGNYYCYRIVGYYNSATADWSTTVLGSWVPFQAINKSTQTITYTQPADKTYGASNFSLTISASSSLTVQLTSNTPDICTVSGTTITIVGVGNCSITAEQPGDVNYYAADPQVILFTVSPAALTITASSHSLNYGDSVPTITASYSGFVRSDTSSSLSVQPTCTSSYTVTTNAGSSITTSCSGASSNNYTITYQTGTISVAQVTLTVTASSHTVNYGDSVPTITPTITGFKNSQNSSVFSVQPSCTTTYTTTTNAGASTTTSCSGAQATNYAFSYTNGSVTVEKRPLTVTASSHDVNLASSTAVPTISAQYNSSEFVNGQSSTAFTTQPTCSTTYTTSSGAGNYPSTCSGALATNYSFTYVSGTVRAFDNSKAEQVITFPTPSNRTYGANYTLDSTPTNAHSSGTVGTLPSPVTITSNTPSVCTISNGVITMVSAGTCTLVANVDGNSSYNPAPTVTKSFTINKATLSITSSSHTVNYGDTVPTVSPSYSGFVKSETQSTSGVLSSQPSCTTNYVVTDNVGTSRTTSCSGAAADNYTISYTGGTVTINKATLTVTAGSYTVNYGDSAPTVSKSITGFKNNETESVLGTAPTCTSDYSSSKNVGDSVSTSCSSGQATNYDFSYVNGSITINKTQLTVTASDHSITYGDAVPTVTRTITGFVYSQGTSAIGTLPTCTTTYTVGSSVGTYTTQCSSALATNYSFTYVDGTVTVGKASLTARASSHSLAVGAAKPTISATYTGYVANDSSSNVTVSGITCDSVYTSASGAGSYTTTCSGGSTTNYLISSYIDGLITVTSGGGNSGGGGGGGGNNSKLDQTITMVNPGTKTYGNNSFSLDATANSGLPVTLVSGTPSICTISGNVITILAAGNCSITGSQSGNTTYNAASNVTLVFTINPAVAQIRASSHVVNRRDAIPRITFTVSGLVNNDPTSALGRITCSTSYRTNSTPGSYLSFCSGSSSSNYTVQFISGIVTVLGGQSSPQVSPTPTPTATNRTATPTPTATIRPNASPTPIIPQATLPSPSVSASELPTVVSDSFNTIDYGAGVKKFEGNLNSLKDIPTNLGQRTPERIASEKLTGFASGNGIRIEVFGARTTAQIIVANASVADPVTIASAIEESRNRTQTEFAAITQAEPVAKPVVTEIIGGKADENAIETFRASGLANPITVGQLNITSASKWIKVNASVTTYKPGSIVYLAVTTQPVIFGAAVVDKFGNADFSGLLPVDALTGGGHSIRIVGLRELDGVSTDNEGQIVLADETMQEIQKFDDGTKSTIKVSGQNVAGGKNLVIREILLLKVDPWWTIVLVSWTVFLVVLAKRYRKLTAAREKVTGQVVIGVATLPALILGWYNASYQIMGIGAVIGIAGAVLVKLLPAKRLKRSNDAD